MYDENSKFYRLLKKIIDIGYNKMSEHDFDCDGIIYKALLTQYRQYATQSKAEYDSLSLRVEVFKREIESDSQIEIDEKYLTLAVLEYRSERNNERFYKYASSILRDDPNNPFANYYMQHYYSVEGDDEESFLYCRKAYEMLPTSHVFVNDYATKLASKGNYWTNIDESIRLYLKADELGSEYALYNAGCTYKHDNQPLLALKYFGMSFEKSEDRDSLLLFFKTIEKDIIPIVDSFDRTQIKHLSNLIKIGANYNYAMAEYLFGRVLVRLSPSGEQYMRHTVVFDQTLTVGLNLIIDSCYRGSRIAQNYINQVLGIYEEDFHIYDRRNEYDPDLRIDIASVFQISNMTCFEYNF